MMGGNSERSRRAPHALSLVAATCFTAIIAFAGVRDLGVDAVMLIETGPSIGEASDDAGPASTVAAPAAQDVAAGTRLSPADDSTPSPSTAAPTSTPTSTPTRVAETTPPTTVDVPPTTLLADLLGEVSRGAALPDDIEPRSRPVGLATSEFDVAGVPIRAVGIEDDGQLEVPDETEIGWYQYGSTAGRPGATVLAAHVSWNNTTGPFFRLDTLEPGSQVEVALDDGSTRTYEVTERTMYEKDQLPRERIWRNTGPETLVLITCGGDFNPDVRRYRHNIVVYAVPVG